MVKAWDVISEIKLKKEVKNSEAKDCKKRIISV